MPRCTTCSLLFKEPWTEFEARLGGTEKADAYHYAAYLDPDARLFPFYAAYCYGQEPQFAIQVGGKFEAKSVPAHDFLGEEHDCRFYQPATGHVKRDAAISIYHQQKVNMSTPAPSIHITDNTGIIAINSTLTQVTQSIGRNDSIPENKRKELLKLFEELKSALALAPKSHSEEAEVAAEQAASIAKEFERKPPRKSMLEVSGKGLIEAAKSLAEVAPTAISIADKIAKFVSGAAA